MYTERQGRRQLTVRPLVEVYFTWVRENLPKIPQKSKIWEGFNYSLNQERYLKVFLDDLLLWSPNLPANCRKPGKDEMK